MSLLDNVRQTLSDVAGNVVDSTRQLSEQTQLQLALKKLQVERAKRIHELGKQTFAWYQTGNLQVSGAVPPDVAEACRALEDIERQTNDTERALEAAREEAAQKNQPPGTGATITVAATAIPDAANPDPSSYNPPPPGAYPPPNYQYPPQAPPAGAYPPPNYQQPPQAPPPNWQPPTTGQPPAYGTAPLPSDDPKNIPGAGGPPAGS